MAKKASTGNQAVSGITSTSTTKPTTSVPKTSSSSKSSGGSRSYSSGYSGGSSAYVDPGPSYANQFYNAYASGVPSTANIIDIGADARTTERLVNEAKASIPQYDVQKVERIDTAEQEAQLKKIAEEQTKQALERINYAVENGKTALNRTYEDALPEFQTQRNQIAIDEANALDNQALYASKRGDNGGIGSSQYGSIQNTAATNTQLVNNAQVKLYTDTSRQIADLQAQGEFEKADKVLEISQEYTEKLMDLQKWAKEQNIGVDEFNAKIDEWKAEYDLSVAKYLTDTELNAAKATGVFSDGTITADLANDMADRYVNGGKAMMSAGIIPSAEQLAAMGWTPEQYWIYQQAQRTA